MVSPTAANPSGAITLVSLVLAPLGAWGLARRVRPRSAFDARLATAHRVAAGLCGLAAVAWGVYDARAQGTLRFSPAWHPNVYGLVAAAVAHGLCRALTGKPWFDRANPRTAIRTFLEPVTWFATLLFAAVRAVVPAAW